MKYLILLLFPLSCLAQDNMLLYRKINAYRQDSGLKPLIYKAADQHNADIRVDEISIKFELRDECDCDGESIAGDETINALISKLVNSKDYDWIHLHPLARYASISVKRRNNYYYAVIRVFIHH